jgi:Flp pilus assembly protein TadG
MDYWIKNRFSPLLAREDGVVSVELVILFPILVLIVVGVVEFGHLWFVRQTLTNASREGVRAAVVYYSPDPSNPGAANRQTWVVDTAQAVVAQYLKDTKFPETCDPAEVDFPQGTGDGTPNGMSGLPVMVTVTSPTSLIVLNKLFPSLNDIKLSAETTMRLE